MNYAVAYDEEKRHSQKHYMSQKGLILNLLVK